MSPAFLLTKLFKTQKIALYSTTKPASFLHGGCLFLRRISSNTSCASEKSSPVKPSAEASASSKRLEKSTLTRKEVNRDYTVSYLVESCGLSPKDALSASEKVHFASPERPNSVLDLLRNHGFTSTQITHTVRTFPGLLGTDAEKTILPKLEFFQSIGVSKFFLARMLSYSPYIMTRSFKNQIEPVCNFIKSFVQSDKNVCTAIKRGTWLLTTNPEKLLVPNIAMLEQIGVPRPSISLLLTHFPRVLLQDSEQFRSVVSKVKEMGFNTSISTFVLALQALSGKGKKQIWDRSYETYSTKWGWSEEDIFSAFKKHPHCMIMSEKKLNSAMEFLVNKMGWSSKCVAQKPIVLLYSLEKRIVPRCNVIRGLWTKGLLSKDLCPNAVLTPVEKIFLKRYVTKYEEQVPQLLSLYRGEMDAKDL